MLGRFYRLTRPIRTLVWLPLLLLVGLPAEPGEKLFARRHTVFRVQIRPMSAVIPGEGESGLRTVEFRSGKEGRTEFPIAWPDPDRPSKLELRLREAAPSASTRHALVVEARLSVTDGPSIRSERNIALDDRATGLFEVYRVGDRALTLALDAEAEIETVYSATPTATRPFGFRIEVVRVLEGRTIRLESDELTTFMGDAVSYAFRLGSGPEAEAVEVRMTPVRVLGEIAEFEVQLAGSLPGASGVEVIGRTERRIASRGTAVTISVESGSPPTGYRFLVTPHF